MIKVALIHDWLVSVGGAEKTLLSLLSLYPHADLFVLIKSEKTLERLKIPSSKVRTTFIQKLPFALTWYRNYLPLFPWAIESLDLSSYDLILSNSHAVAKGVRTHAGQLHICYCHTPMRYFWGLPLAYMDQLGTLRGYLARLFIPYLKKWDLKTSVRVNHFVANSQYIKNRIERSYGVVAECIYPPVAIPDVAIDHPREDFYLTVSRLVFYKRVDLMVEAFNRMPLKRLYVIGKGPEEKKLRKKAHKNILFLGFQPEEVVLKHLQRSKGFILAAEEDFGIAAVEAQAYGTPVIAYGKGGALESIIPYQTGIFFHEQNIDSLIQAIEIFETYSFNTASLHAHARRFDEKNFQQQMRRFVQSKWQQFHEGR